MELLHFPSNIYYRREVCGVAEMPVVISARDATASDRIRPGEGIACGVVQQ